MQRLIASFITCLIWLALFGVFPVAKAQGKHTGRQKAQSPSWVKVAPKGAGFSVLMPSAPAEEISAIDYPPMKVPTRLYVVKNGEASFFAGRFGDFPRQLVDAGYINVLFENAHKIFFESKGKDGAIDTLSFTRRDINPHGIAGREYISECGPYKKADGPCIGIIRVFKSGDSIFVVGLAGPKSVLTEGLTGKYLSSFALTK